MAYALERNDVIVVPRYDICLDHDMMVIEIQQRPHKLILVVNIYNPPLEAPERTRRDRD